MIPNQPVKGFSLKLQYSFIFKVFIVVLNRLFGALNQTETRDSTQHAFDRRAEDIDVKENVLFVGSFYM